MFIYYKKLKKINIFKKTFHSNCNLYVNSYKIVPFINILKKGTEFPCVQSTYFIDGSYNKLCNKGVFIKDDFNQAMFKKHHVAFHSKLNAFVMHSDGSSSYENIYFFTSFTTIRDEYSDNNYLFHDNYPCKIYSQSYQFNFNQLSNISKLKKIEDKDLKFDNFFSSFKSMIQSNVIKIENSISKDQFFFHSDKLDDLKKTYNIDDDKVTNFDDYELNSEGIYTKIRKFYITSDIDTGNKFLTDTEIDISLKETSVSDLNTGTGTGTGTGTDIDTDTDTGKVTVSDSDSNSDSDVNNNENIISELEDY